MIGNGTIRIIGIGRIEMGCLGLWRIGIGIRRWGIWGMERRPIWIRMIIIGIWSNRTMWNRNRTNKSRFLCGRSIFCKNLDGSRARQSTWSPYDSKSWLNWWANPGSSQYNQSSKPQMQAIFISASPNNTIPHNRNKYSTAWVEKKKGLKLIQNLTKS